MIIINCSNTMITTCIDEVTWISKNLIRQDRSRISIIKKLKQLDIIVHKVISIKIFCWFCNLQFINFYYRNRKYVIENFLRLKSFKLLSWSMNSEKQVIQYVLSWINWM